MGNIVPQLSYSVDANMHYTTVDNFEFHGIFEHETLNGSNFCNHYLPEEIIFHILSYIPPNQVLNLTLVCKKWCNIIKSHHFWMYLYNEHLDKAKLLPWYIYYSFFTTKNYSNLLKNTNGEERFKFWKIIKNFGDEFQIEDPPLGADPLPSNVKDFNGHTSCFATSFYECNKIQVRNFWYMYIKTKGNCTIVSCGLCQLLILCEIIVKYLFLMSILYIYIYIIS